MTACHCCLEYGRHTLAMLLFCSLDGSSIVEMSRITAFNLYWQDAVCQEYWISCELVLASPRGHKQWAAKAKDLNPRPQMPGEALDAMGFQFVLVEPWAEPRHAYTTLRDAILAHPTMAEGLNVLFTAGPLRARSHIKQPRREQQPGQAVA